MAAAWEPTTSTVTNRAPREPPVVNRLTHAIVEKISSGDTSSLHLVAASPEVLSLAAPTVRFALYSAALALIADSRGVFSSGTGVKPESASAMRALSAVLNSPTDASLELRQLLRESGPEELRRLRLHRHVNSQKDDVRPAAMQFIARLIECLRLRPEEFISEPLTVGVQEGIRETLEIDRAQRVAQRHRAASAHGNQRGDTAQSEPTARAGRSETPNGPPVNRPRAATGMFHYRTQFINISLPTEPSSQPPPLNPLFVAPSPEAPVTFSLGVLTPPSAVTFFAKHFGLGCVPTLPPAELFRAIQKRAADEAAGVPNSGPSSPTSSTDPSRKGIATFMPRLEAFSTIGSALLERYLSDDGYCVGWGTSRFGELGPEAMASGAGHTPPVALALSFPDARHSSICVATRPIAAALGNAFTLWLLDNGTAATHGSGDWGQLGIGQLKLGASNVSTVGLQVASKPCHLARSMRSSDVLSAVRAGFAYSAGITARGDLYLWGNNNHGQCSIGSPLPPSGNVSFARQLLPQKVTLKNCPIIDLAAGSFFVVALTSFGSVLSWGLLPMLGVGTEDEAKAVIPPSRISTAISNEPKLVTTTPVRIPSLDNKCITSIAAGQWHAACVSEAGAVYTWGVGYQGRLGHGNAEQIYTPKFVEALKEYHVLRVSCGSFHTAVLTSRGTVLCFGDNAAGQCGYVGKTHVTIPVAPQFPGNDAVTFISVACGREHTVCLTSSGDVWAFGSGPGLGVTGMRARLFVPRPTLLQHVVIRLDSGMTHVVGLCVTRCLSLLALGDLPGRGGPRTLLEPKPTAVNIHSMTCGAGFVVVADANGVVHSAGAGDWGQLGLGDTSKLGTGPSVAAAGGVPAVVCTSLSVVEELRGHNIVHVAAGYAFAFALSDTGKVFFWGNNNHGQSALGAASAGKLKYDSPVLVPALSFETPSIGGASVASTPVAVTAPVVQIAAGSFFGVALTADGKVFTWGHPDCSGLYPEEWQNAEALTATCRRLWAESAVRAHTANASPGEGSGDRGSSSRASSPSASTTGAVDAILAAAQGLRVTDVMGTSQTKDPRPVIIRPVHLHHIEEPVIQIAAGQWHAAALTEQAVMLVWGLGHGGRLGHGSCDSCFVPTRIAVPSSGPMATPIAYVACGSFNTAAVTAGGALYVWGDNEHGQCGFTNPTLSTDRPVLARAAGVRTVALGRHHCLVTLIDGSLEFAGAMSWSGVPEGIRCPSLDRFEAVLEQASSAGVTSPLATYSKMLQDAAKKTGAAPLPATDIRTTAVSTAAGPHHVCVLLEVRRPGPVEVTKAAAELDRCTAVKPVVKIHEEAA